MTFMKVVSKEISILDKSGFRGSKRTHGAHAAQAPDAAAGPALHRI